MDFTLYKIKLLLLFPAHQHSWHDDRPGDVHGVCNALLPGKALQLHYSVIALGMCTACVTLFSQVKHYRFITKFWLESTVSCHAIIMFKYTCRIMVNHYHNSGAT